MKHLSSEQITALLNATESKRDRLLLTMCYEHGLRVSEALALTPARVKNGFLNTQPLKDGDITSQSLKPSTLELWNELTAHLDANKRVFRFTRQWAAAIFHRAAVKANVPLREKQGIHTLRHSCAHTMLDLGAPLTVIQRKLGHKNIATTSIYLEADDQAVDNWSARAFG